MAEQSSPAELTYRGLALGALITLVFTAANVYLGLKVGLTIATSIPAAVISMAALRAFKGSGILENNIVQTVASSAGTLSAIIFVLPGLVMVGWWSGFSFWPTFFICALGGTLGVMLTIPLRRALITQSTLPYPEGVAAAEVLKAGTSGEENKRGLRTIIVNALIAAGFNALVGARLFTDELAGYFRVGNATSGVATSLSFALIGAGHLAGISVGAAMLLGYFLAWGVATPVLTALHPAVGTAMEVGRAAWSTQVRFIGAGAIGVAALWALIQLIGPLREGLATAFTTSKLRRTGTEELPLQERDIPIGIVGTVSVVLLIPIGILLTFFFNDAPIQEHIPALVAGGVIYIVVASVLVAAVCGYMAGLIGSSNSPLSGIGILAVLGAALLLALFAAPSFGDEGRPMLVAYSLFVTAVIFAAATIANDNLQDLKTGQLVGATPWRQQVALIVGVVVGAMVIPPVLNLLNEAYGFAGAVRSATAVTTDPLPAPQATLIATLARGVLGDDLNWNMLGIGAILGVALVMIDAVHKRAGLMRLPPLAVGIGMYLPMQVTIPVFIGGLLRALYERKVRGTPSAAQANRMGVLMASGFIVGESIFGVLLAGLIVASSKGAPLAIMGAGFHDIAILLGVVAFAGLLWKQYRASARVA